MEIYLTERAVGTVSFVSMNKVLMEMAPEHRSKEVEAKREKGEHAKAKQGKESRER